MSATNISVTATEEQLLYAKILEKGMYFGLLLMFVTFALYVLGIMPAIVPKDMVAEYWNLPVGEYLETINHNYIGWAHGPTGWSWMKLIGNGDFLNFVPIAILSGVTIICYAAIVPGLFQRGDKAYGIMAIAEVLILALAASGLLAVGH
ncbi:MAG: DUF1634 domain-containing protein [Proteobacteria bacterium]|nr:DUF1634 domain-containing protein [Pseudomonadota bacterium]MBU1687977.1 DUF1634 domain-containing protein [Pseudomonadota bacterium]